MSDFAIRVAALGKQYRIAHLQQRHDTLRDALAHAASRTVQRLRRGRLRQPREENTIWALRDISFEVQRGEVVGIIGANGAGKSTLLKILARITEPTVGEAEVRGRVGSLLEVGTGFNWELSGRENIYLNGAILGMKRAEINQKFDEIVAFSEVERFIDTPVKHYSSGMYLRLAFAVAAHLEPEILIVDEVLAVGDAAFQKKCLGKMSDVAHAGRTVLFVSHNMDAVRRLCTRCVLLEQGRIAMTGDTLGVTTRYLSNNLDRGRPDEWIDLANASRTGTGEARIVALRYRCPGEDSSLPHTGGPFEVTLTVLAREALVVRCLSLMVRDSQGYKLLNADIASLGQQVELQPGSNLIRISIEQLHLNPGVYVLGCWIARKIEDEKPLDYVESGTSFEVTDNDPQGFAYPWAVGPVASRFTVRQLFDEGAGAAIESHLSGV